MTPRSPGSKIPAHEGPRARVREGRGPRADDLDEGVALLEQGDTHILTALAHQRRMHLHPEPVVTYIVERNINYTNSCVTYCRFCAFYRRPGHAEGYVLSHEQLGREDRGGARAGRGPDPAAGRPPPRPAADLVRGDAPLHQARVPDRQRARVQRARDRAHREPGEDAGARRDRAAARRRPGHDPRRRRRDPRRSRARHPRAAQDDDLGRDGSTSTATRTASACAAPPR